MQFSNLKDIEWLTHWVAACIILHNMLTKIWNQWVEMYEASIIDSPPLFSGKVSSKSVGGLREIIKPTTLQHFGKVCPVE